MASPLAQQLVARLPAEACALLSNPLKAAESWLYVGHERWPACMAPTAAFVSYLVDRLPGPDRLARALLHWHTDELFLSWACLERDRAAASVFEVAYMPAVFAAIRRLQLQPSEVEEHAQRVRVLLLVGQGSGGPQLAGYRGLGRLRSWLAVVTRRTVVASLRRQADEPELELERFVHRLVRDEDDPALAAAKRRYRDLFRQCFQRALDELSAKQQMLLRFRYGDALSLPDIGRIFAVSHVSVHRWLEDTRMTLLFRTRDLFVGNLGVRAGEYSSLLRLIQSHMDFTLSSLFGGASSETPAERT